MNEYICKCGRHIPCRHCPEEPKRYTPAWGVEYRSTRDVAPWWRRGVIRAVWQVVRRVVGKNDQVEARRE
jgi:hypothetical protein